jgi:hypothetical protein
MRQGFSRIVKGLLATLAVLAMPGCAEGELKFWPQYVKLDSWAHRIPVQSSGDISAIAFTGRHANYTNADTWYPSWASDGYLYSPWTDGSIGDEKCTSWGRENAHTGQARIMGDDPLDLEVISLGKTRGSALPYQGRYPCGSLVLDGIWYYGTYCLLEDPSLSMNWPILGPFVGFRISHDLGKTWDDAGMSPTNNLFQEQTDLSARPVKFGAPHFVDFGKNMEHSPDGYAYLVCHSARVDDRKPRPGNLSWISGDHIHLIRVKPSPETINDRSAYEFFAGRDEEGKAVWSKEIGEIKPIFEWNNKAGCVTMTYNAPLKKYLMCITDGWPTIQSMDTYILESDHITGPWKIVSYMKDFGPQAYFINIPSKFISEDGKRAWLCYSANFAYSKEKGASPGNPEGSHYSLSLHEIVFVDPEG